MDRRFWLPDAIWLKIFEYLTSFDLLNLQDTDCHVFCRVANDKSLWRHVTVQEPPTSTLTKSQLRRLIPFFGVHTKSLNISRRRGKSKAKATGIVSPAFLRSLKLRCPKLVRLTLENETLDTNEISFGDFPKSIQSLWIRSCHLTNLPLEELRGERSSPLRPLQKGGFDQLTEIRLESNPWVKSCDLKVCGKIKSVKSVISFC